MMIITQNAEKKLLEQLDVFSVRCPTMRCLHLRLSTLSIDFEKWFKVFVRECNSFFEDDMMAVYVCHDRDVFITGRSITQKRLDQFLTHLTLKLRPALKQELANLFEVGIDWSRLKTVCKRKIELFSMGQEKRKFQKKDECAAVSRKEAMAQLNRDLTSSLSMRRDMRKDPEIMVVEDDLFSQKLVRTSLRQFNLTVVSDGQGAVMNYINKAPDVLFLDIGLPDIDGLQVLQKIFELDPLAYVVMFSGNGHKENILKAVEIGAKGFVGKPFTKDKLIQYIEKSPHVLAKKGS
ncbi:MAG: response regulator [Alphaproteobacteria bacterium]